MRMSAIAAAIAATLALPAAASAATFTQSVTHVGDICALDVDQTGGLDDCATLLQGNGNPLGVFTLRLSGLNPKATGNVKLTISSASADLFNTDGTNNPNERFELFIDGISFGTLFDGSTLDEAAINQSLADSVADNIALATATTAPMNICFALTVANFSSMIADGELIATLDFRNDLNINRFVDPTFSVSYDVAAVPLPGSALLLLSGLAGITTLRRRRRN